jgi:hypothetical protein
MIKVKKKIDWKNKKNVEETFNSGDDSIYQYLFFVFFILMSFKKKCSSSIIFCRIWAYLVKWIPMYLLFFIFQEERDVFFCIIADFLRSTFLKKSGSMGNKKTTLYVISIFFNQNIFFRRQKKIFFCRYFIKIAVILPIELFFRKTHILKQYFMLYFYMQKNS